MNKGLKIAIGVLTIGIVGTATYLIIKKIRDTGYRGNRKLFLDGKRDINIL